MRIRPYVTIVLPGLVAGLSVAAIAIAGCSQSDSGSNFRKKPTTNSGTGTGTDNGASSDDDSAGASPGSDNGSGTFGDQGSGTPATQCVNLQCKQVQCANSGHTTVSGTVFDPAGRNPLYNVVVYVPNSTPQVFSDRATCDKCEALYTGDPVVTTLTGPDGRFTLKDVPAGDNIPLVIQVGKWRRQITIPNVPQCADTVLDRSLSRLPANRSEGDLPKIAISTGSADSMECLLRRIGVDANEFVGGIGGGTERIHIFQGNGNIAQGSPPSTQLWGSAATLSRYDMVVLSCEGDENTGTKPASSLAALQQYANSGGRVFASHFHYYWFNHGPAPFPNTATWTSGSQDLGDINGIIDQSFPKGLALAQWMRAVNGLLPNGQVQLLQARHNADVDPRLNVGSQAWISGAGGGTQYFTFNTPMNAAEDAQCGRVVYSDLHVGAGANDYKNGVNTVPLGCAVGDLSPQEKALEFMLFDLSSCVTPDGQAPAPPPPSPK